MKISRFAPHEALKPLVKTFMVVESRDVEVNNVLPDTSIIMAFRLQGRVTLGDRDYSIAAPLSTLTGIRKTSQRLQYEDNTATLLVALTEGSAGQFLGEPLHELSGRSVPLDQFFPRSTLASLEEQLSEPSDLRRKVSAVESFLLKMFKARRPDLLVIDAVQAIKRARGKTRIDDLMKSIPLSRDPFEKRFRRTIGTSPKQFSRIIRLRHVIERLPQGNNLADAALDAGYFDQAHFSKDFKSFTGRTPGEFLSSFPLW